MKVVFNPRHAEHAPAVEIYRGLQVPAHEVPLRAELVHEALCSDGGHAFVAPAAHPDGALASVHDARYLEFLRTAHQRWQEAGHPGDAFPAVWPIRGMRSDRIPNTLAAQLGRYSFDSGSPLGPGTWTAARAGADAALTGADLISSGEPAVFVLTRPPGHHAGVDFYGGYCFLNNAALAAQALRTAGAARVAVLDVDFHHGNGTQSIFYARRDVLTVSLHGDPATEYPFFLGHADETGIEAGAGYNLNLPLPVGCGPAEWFAALDCALARVREHAPAALVVSLGVDTWAGDPICGFELRSEDYPCLGTAIARLRIPTLFVLEGGYAVHAIGENVAGVLRGFSSA
jgi:acetoin utilization deacetylase AcuC-like enzyme